jgi:hypothetical protein
MARLKIGRTGGRISLSGSLSVRFGIINRPADRDQSVSQLRRETFLLHPTGETALLVAAFIAAFVRKEVFAIFESHLSQEIQSFAKL